MEQDLQDDTDFFRIDQRKWKIGHSVKSKGVTAVGISKMQKHFGEDYAHIDIEGVVLGPNSDDKMIRVQWDIPDRPITTHLPSSHLMKSIAIPHMPKRKLLWAASK